MQAVSEEWKQAQKQNFVPVSAVLLSFLVGEPEADGDGTGTDNGCMPFGDSSCLTDTESKTPRPYASLEQNLWLLDGSMEALPEQEPPDSNIGFVSTLRCGSDGRFRGITPQVTIEYSKTYQAKIPGITVVWSEAFGEYATEFRVTVYAGNQKIASREVTANRTVLSAVWMDLEEWDTIVIEVLAWSHPNHRCRVETAAAGILNLYQKDDFIRLTHEQSGDMLSNELPKHSVVWEIDNSDGRWNPDNPSGAERWLLERQAIHLQYGFKINRKMEWILGGTFYCSEWETPANGTTATFTGRDLLEFLSAKYAGPRKGTLQELAEAALVQGNLPKSRNGTVKWILSKRLSGLDVDFEADTEEYTLAEILQLAANAARCVLYQGRDGILRIEPLFEELQDYQIDQFTSWEDGEISTDKQLAAVDVNDGLGLFETGLSGETEYLTNPLISSAEQAAEVAEWAAQVLAQRHTIRGEYRADPRLDLFDRVRVENKYTSREAVITDIKYEYKGAFHGSYEGRVME